MSGPKIKQLPKSNNRFPQPSGRSSLFFTQNSPRQTWQVEFDSTLYLRPKGRRFFAQNKQISSEDLLSLVKTRSLDFRIDSPGLNAVLLSSFTSRILSALWSSNCDLRSLRIKISQKPFIKKQKKFLQLENFQKLNNQNF